MVLYREEEMMHDLKHFDTGNYYSNADTENLYNTSCYANKVY